MLAGSLLILFVGSGLLMLTPMNDDSDDGERDGSDGERDGSILDEEVIESEDLSLLPMGSCEYFGAEYVDISIEYDGEKLDDPQVDQLDGSIEGRGSIEYAPPADEDLLEIDAGTLSFEEQYEAQTIKERDVDVVIGSTNSEPLVLSGFTSHDVEVDIEEEAVERIWFRYESGTLLSKQDVFDANMEFDEDLENNRTIVSMYGNPVLIVENTTLFEFVDNSLVIGNFSLRG